jgi:di/tripeptidase
MIRKKMSLKKYIFKIYDGISGHSGATIHEKRANCIVETFNILFEMYKKFKFNIVNVKAGEVANAIPGSCEVIISFENDIEEFKKESNEIFNQFKQAYEEYEPNLKLAIDEIDNYELDDFDDDSTKNLINFIVAANNGMNTYSFKQNMTTSSTNIGKIFVLENVVTLI